jgi:micrococcal nuclease|tara:strand:+ start:462 stop:860 length:399 start_codon:yes stop_codon:yes gene_type:complete
MITPNYTFNAKLIRVVDGDTVWAHVDLGFDIWKKVNIRLYGIDTPETRTRDLVEKRAGFVAKARLMVLLEQGNNEFVLVSKEVDKYGRALGELYNGLHEVHVHEGENRPISISINQVLLNEGLAKPYNGGKR